jgi:hypothetical protein
MSDHLPECFSNKLSGDSRHCICPELRSCEQRVLSLNPVANGVLIAQRAREHALDAAREAIISAITKECEGHLIPNDEYDCYGCPSFDWIIEDVLAAIDTLRGAR